MKTIKVKDMMVLIKEYATVNEDDNLYQAVLALEEAQQRFSRDRYKHRAVLVYGANNKVVGKLSQLDVIRGLESGYRKIGDLRGVEHSGFSSELIRSMIARYSLWQQPLEDICRRAPHIKVKSIMYSPTEGEYVDQEETLDQAIHQLVMGRHQSLLVTKGEEIVGILRLTDVFAEICSVIKTCRA
ncbi:MAG: CBS domain-containing protein [Deltaproteobacteria bacterium]|jgi:CBS domain-containing protein